MKATEYWVCAGERILTKSSGEAWFVLEGRDSNVVGLEPLYFPKGRGKSSIGGVYEIEVSRNGTQTQMGRGKYVREFTGKKLIAEWTAKADAAHVAARIDAQERKLKDSAIVYSEVLAPFRRAYATSDPVGRNVILAKVLHHITRL